jgi:hypothetical protein
MMDDNDGPTVVLDYVQDVTVIRVLGIALIPVRLSIKAEVMPLDETTQTDIEIACAKLKFWFETVVNRCICISRHNADGLALFTAPDGRMKAANMMMVTPFDPTDEHLATLFQAKIGALSDDTLLVGYVRVASQDKAGLVATYIGTWIEDLPPMKDWFATKPYYFETPWWTRADISMIDMLPIDSPNFDIRPKWAYTLDFIDEAMRPSAAEPLPTQESVIYGKFRPTVIDGGNPDDQNR